jgi:vacuolar-type H+-ATPase subunit C/Vma6
MSGSEIALVARAKGVSGHLLERKTLEDLAEADDLGAFGRAVARLGAAIEPIGEAADVFAIERAIARTANRHVRTLHRYQERTPGLLDVFMAEQDRRSLRALLRGAAQGAPPERRLEGLVPTRALPRRALAELARQASPSAVVRQLVLLSHPDAPRLLPLVQRAQPDLLAVDQALLLGFAQRATQAAARSDETLREYLSDLIDIGNAQTALLITAGPRDVAAADSFVPGGRWLSRDAFVSAATALSQHDAMAILATSFAGSPLASLLPAAATNVAHIDRAFLSNALQRLERAARLAPLSSAPVLLVLLRIEAQSRDLRTLAWGAALGTPPPLRKQRLLTRP